jgi:hypothetical protein
MFPEFRRGEMEKKWKAATSVCLLHTENRNGELPLFAANGNGKWKVCFTWSENNNRKSTIASSANLPIYICPDEGPILK